MATLTVTETNSTHHAARKRKNPHSRNGLPLSNGSVLERHSALDEDSGLEKDGALEENDALTTPEHPDFKSLVVGHESTIGPNVRDFDQQIQEHRNELLKLYQEDDSKTQLLKSLDRQRLLLSPEDLAQFQDNRLELLDELCDLSKRILQRLDAIIELSKDQISEIEKAGKVDTNAGIKEDLSEMEGTAKTNKDTAGKAREEEQKIKEELEKKREAEEKEQRDRTNAAFVKPPPFKDYPSFDKDVALVNDGVAKFGALLSTALRELWRSDETNAALGIKIEQLTVRLNADDDNRAARNWNATVQNVADPLKPLVHHLKRTKINNFPPTINDIEDYIKTKTASMYELFDAVGVTNLHFAQKQVEEAVEASKHAAPAAGATKVINQMTQQLRVAIGLPARTLDFDATAAALRALNTTII